MIKLYFGKHLKSANTWISCTKGKSSKNPLGFPDFSMFQLICMFYSTHVYLWSSLILRHPKPINHFNFWIIIIIIQKLLCSVWLNLTEYGFVCTTLAKPDWMVARSKLHLINIYNMNMENSFEVCLQFKFLRDCIKTIGNFSFQRSRISLVLTLHV